VRLRDRRRIPPVRATLDRFGAQFMNDYGRLSTEELSLWRGEEPAIPDALRR
jgi:hypothetical protein